MKKGFYMKALKRDIGIGIVFSVIVGTLAHFVYEWTGKNPIAAIFFPINESVWEHVKLLFFPTLLYGLFLIKKWKEAYPCIVPSVPVGIVIGSLSIPAFFYFYTAQGAYDEKYRTELVTILAKQEYRLLLNYLHTAQKQVFVTVSTGNEVIGEWNKHK